MDGDRSFAPRRFGGVHLARSFKRANHFDAKLAHDRRARLFRVVVKDVVTVRPQPRLTPNELPHFPQRRTPRRPHRARRRRPFTLSAVAKGRHLPRTHHLHVDLDRHPRILIQLAGVAGHRVAFAPASYRLPFPAPRLFTLSEANVPWVLCRRESRGEGAQPHAAPLPASADAPPAP